MVTGVDKEGATNCGFPSPLLDDGADRLLPAPSDTNPIQPTLNSEFILAKLDPTKLKA
jgi:hypothetical protein